MVDRLGDAEMLHLRVGEGLVDRVDRPARHAHFVQPLDPIGVWVLADDLVQMRIQRRAVLGAGDDRRKIRVFGEVFASRHLAEAAPQIVARGRDVDIAVGRLEHAGAGRSRMVIAFLAGHLALHQIARGLEIEHKDLRFEQ